MLLQTEGDFHLVELLESGQLKYNDWEARIRKKIAEEAFTHAKKRADYTLILGLMEFLGTSEKLRSRLRGRKTGVESAKEEKA